MIPASGGEDSAQPGRRAQRPERDVIYTKVLRDELDKARFIRQLQRAPVKDAKDRPLIVFVRRAKKRRTPKQNRMMHMVWGFFEELAGWGKDEAKEWFKEQYGPVIEMVLGGTRRSVPKPSAKYTPKEAQEMIDTVYRVANEAGFVLPEPHDEDSWQRYADQLEATA